MYPLSNDLRQRIVDAYNRGEGSQRELARRFNVSQSSVERLCARFKATGSISPSPRHNGPGPIVDRGKRILWAGFGSRPKGVSIDAKAIQTLNI